jgi:hypothetical protein
VVACEVNGGRGFIVEISKIDGNGWFGVFASNKPILTITSSNTLYANEGVNNTTHTLVANDTEATFSIIEDTTNLFSIDGQTLTFNGTTANFESNTKSYTFIVNASTGIVAG